MDNGNSDIGDDCLRGGYVAGSSYHAGPSSSGACGFKQRNPNSCRSPHRHAHQAIQDAKEEPRIDARIGSLMSLR